MIYNTYIIILYDFKSAHSKYRILEYNIIKAHIVIINIEYTFYTTYNIKYIIKKLI